MNYKPLKAVDYIVVHCAATTSTMDIGAKEIDRWHRERGFFQIGYHRVIRRNGVIEQGRDMGIPGAHARGYNERSLAICLVGGCRKDKKSGTLVAENNFTDEQWESLRTELRAMRALHPNARIVGHRDLLLKDHAQLKDCPSFDVQAWLAENNFTNPPEEN